MRVYAGTLKSGDTVMNTTKDHRERIGRMFQMHADKRAEIKEVHAGDIAAFVGLKDTGTGDTLASQQDPVVLERMAFPVPVIDISVEPRTKEAVEKMSLGLQKLAAEDPSLRLRTDQESGQTILSGMGELHLEIIIDRMMREYKVEANVGKPQVAYRETIRKHSEAEGKYIRQTGERRVRVGLDSPAAGMLAILLAFARGDADARHIDRRGQVVDHRVEQRLYALVLERGAAQDREEGA